MAAGTRISPPEPVSRRCFICNTTCTGTRFRYWRWRSTEGREEYRVDEVSNFAGGGYGGLYRQEQTAAASRVAEEFGRGGRRQESVPHRARSDSLHARRAKAHPMIQKRFPLVMMLEPLHACNLTCTGCGRIREYEDSIT